MVTIFEKNIERPDTEKSRMKFPADGNWTELPIPSPGEFKQLKVKDKGGTQWTLNYKNLNGQIHFTEGWAAFRRAKGIIVDDKIALYKDGAQYRIEVTKKRDS